MMARDEAESTREPINYESFINQFHPYIITSIQQLERINTEICRQKCLYCSIRYVYTVTFIRVYVCVCDSIYSESVEPALFNKFTSSQMKADQAYQYEAIDEISASHSWSQRQMPYVYESKINYISWFTVLSHVFSWSPWYFLQLCGKTGLVDCPSM